MDFVVLLLVGAVLVGAVRSLKKQKKQGRSCCGGCSSCSGNCACCKEKCTTPHHEKD